jgi:hypothetical protein
MNQENRPPPRRSREEIKASIKKLLEKMSVEERKVALELWKKGLKKLWKKLNDLPKRTKRQPSRQTCGDT